MTEQQTEVQRTAARFAREKLPVAHLRALRDTRDSVGFSRALWRELAQLGLVGLILPEKFGGAGLGFAELGLVLAEHGRTLAPLPWLSTVAASALIASPSLAEQYLPDICAGEKLIALAHDEGARHSRRVDMRAERTPGGFRLSGQKEMVLDGHVAAGFVVSAANGRLLFVEAARATVERQWLIDSRNYARVSFHEVEVPEHHLLGETDALLDRMQIALSAEMLGGMEAVFEATLAHLKTRKQFGVLIGSFQALKHRAAAVACERELLRAVVDEALRAADSGDDKLPLFACAAKARASDAFLLAAAEAIQMHGGIGVTDELDIGLYYKRARVAELSFGDSAFQRERFASLKGY